MKKERSGEKDRKGVICQLFPPKYTYSPLPPIPISDYTHTANHFLYSFPFSTSKPKLQVHHIINESMSLCDQRSSMLVVGFFHGGNWIHALQCFCGNGNMLVFMCVRKADAHTHQKPPHRHREQQIKQGKYSEEKRNIKLAHR